MAVDMSAHRSPPGWLFWTRFGALLPVTAVQAVWLKLKAPRMPAVLANADRGSIGDSDAPRTTRLLVVGESPAVGVGCKQPAQTLAMQLAATLAGRSARRVDWQVIGGNGLRAEGLLQLLSTQARVEPADDSIALVLLGANDVVGLTSQRQWQEHLIRLRQQLRARGVGRIALAPVPPMWQFTLLPQPLRSVLGMRARQLDAVRFAVAATYADVQALPSDFPNEPTLLAEDGYHPGPEACRLWAEQIADALLSARA